MIHFFRLIRAMWHFTNAMDDGLKRPSRTEVRMRLTCGSERRFVYPGIQKGWELDLKLDALMDEMCYEAIVSPMKIVRHYPSGKVTGEDIRIYHEEVGEISP